MITSKHLYLVPMGIELSVDPNSVEQRIGFEHEALFSFFIGLRYEVNVNGVNRTRAERLLGLEAEAVTVDGHPAANRGNDFNPSVWHRSSQPKCNLTHRCQF